MSLVAFWQGHQQAGHKQQPVGSQAGVHHSLLFLHALFFLTGNSSSRLP
jgi:hypothetical protein